MPRRDDARSASLESHFRGSLHGAVTDEVVEAAASASCSVRGRGAAGETLGVLVCGDFNSTPEGPLYEYMHERFMRAEGMSFASAYRDYARVAERAGAVDPRWQHALRSIDDDFAGADASAVTTFTFPDAPFTSYNFRRRATIDYIYYQTGSLRLNAVLQVPSIDQVEASPGPEGWRDVARLKKEWPDTAEVRDGLCPGIPNAAFGSDHIPIMAEFSFR